MEVRDVVLLHGQPGLAADWRTLAGLLPPELRVTALDRPGYGDSPEEAGGFAYNARAVLADLDQRGIGQAVVAGHSYGGGVALALAQLAPARVAALVLLASVGPGCVSLLDRVLAAPGSGEACAVAAWSVTPVVARGLVTAITRRRGPLAVGERVYLQALAGARHEHGAVWRSFLTEQRALVTELPGLISDLARITQPVLLMADPRDQVVPMATTLALADALPAAKVRLFRGVGHDIPRTGGQRVASAITGFVAALDGRPTGG